MSANHTIVEELSVTFDEKLAPLKVEIAELRYFIENANQKYDQVLEKLTEQEKACKEIENLWRGGQARNLTTNVPKILYLKSSSEQILSKNCR